MFTKKLAILVAFAMVLAACGGSDDEVAATDAAGATTQAPDDMTDEDMDDDAMDDEDMDDEDMDEAHSHTFTVTISNVSADTAVPTPLAPGAFTVHTSMDTLFTEGQPDRGEGLEALAEDGDPSSLVTSLQAIETVATAGAFANPDGGSEAGPALPGSNYSFTFEAVPGDYLSFATMFVQSNDWFFAPMSSGISLFDGAVPLEGDVTDLVGLWDAGTEVDEEPGLGANQPPRQAGPNTGDDQNGTITMVDGSGVTVTVTVDQ
ncbi:MAG: spondin domain-containing protein [Actinomycetota bacterium]|nr:spondin domain-containing protein [Actinomycetota bacterium]